MKKTNLTKSESIKKSSEDSSISKKRKHGKNDATADSSMAVPTPQKPSIDSSFMLFLADFKASNSK